MCLQLGGRACVNTDVFMVATQPLGFKSILGISGIVALGEAKLYGQRGMRLGVEEAATYAAAGLLSLTIRASMLCTMQ